MTHCGWQNYPTWNVTLWIDNDEKWYARKRKYLALMTDADETPTYRGLIRYMRAIGAIGAETPDEVRWLARTLDYHELDEWLREE